MRFFAYGKKLRWGFEARLTVAILNFTYKLILQSMLPLGDT